MAATDDADGQSLYDIISIDEDLTLRIESFATINSRRVSRKLNWYHVHHANVQRTYQLEFPSLTVLLP